MIHNYQSTGNYDSSLVSMIEEGHNDQGKFNHQEGHDLNVLISKGISITLYHCSMLQATHHILLMKFLKQKKLRG